MSHSLIALQGLRLLVAEDDALILMDIEDMLHDLGCEVVGPVSTVKAAIHAIRQNQIDGAILDLNLHRERTTRVAELLAALDLRFIICTGSGREPDDEEVIRDAPRVEKPFTINALHNALLDVFVHDREK